MSFWTAIVAIAAIIAFANMRTARYRHRAGAADPYQASPYPPSPYQTDPAPSPALEREVTELRKRVEVLERIITDERDTHRLAQDIEALREH